MKHRRRKPLAPPTAVTGDDIDSLAGQTRVAAVDGVDDLRLAAQNRETAKQVFEHIKAAHARAEKGAE